jgi:hypothetical protein
MDEIQKNYGAGMHHFNSALKQEPKNAVKSVMQGIKFMHKVVEGLHLLANRK